MSREDTSKKPPQFYVPLAQEPSGRLVLLARTRDDPAKLSGDIREHVRTLDASLVAEVRTMEEIRAQLFESSNAIIALFLIFAGFALVMASMGIYGVMSFTVRQRRHEIGIRMALGASDADVVRMIAGQGARLIFAGVVAGVVGALLVARLLSSAVAEIRPVDPVTFGAVVAVLGLVALVANTLPARRATRIDPIATLRAE